MCLRREVSIVVVVLLFRRLMEWHVQRLRRSEENRQDAKVRRERIEKAWGEMREE
jgi:hypothetical protein